MFYPFRMFSSPRDTTTLLLYADLFVSRVASIPLFRSSVVYWQLSLMRFCFCTAVESPFHSTGVRAAPPTTTQSRASGGRTSTHCQAKTCTFLMRSTTDSAPKSYTTERIWLYARQRSQVVVPSSRGISYLPYPNGVLRYFRLAHTHAAEFG